MRLNKFFSAFLGRDLLWLSCHITYVSNVQSAFSLAETALSWKKTKNSNEDYWGVSSWATSVTILPVSKQCLQSNMNMRNWRKWTPSIPCITVNKYTNCRNFPLSLQLLIHSTFPSSFQLICSLPVLFLPYYHVLFPFPHPPLVYFGLFSYLPSNYLCTLPINKKKISSQTQHPKMNIDILLPNLLATPRIYFSLPW